MPVVIDGESLTIENLVDVVRHSQEVVLSQASIERIDRCRKMLEEKIADGHTMYGVNTGFGQLTHVDLSREKLQKLQKNIIYSHSAGIGEPMAIEHVRAAMLTRANVHARGFSGCRRQLPEMILAMLNKGCTPLVCKKGSVGASGDLAPMSQIGLAMMGIGEIFVDGQRLSALEGLKRCGLEPIEFQARDGLSLLNGSNVILGVGCLLIHDIENWLKNAEVAAAMSLESLLANLKPLDARLHQIRGFKGAMASAANLRKCLEGGDLMTREVDVKVQDAYSMRSTPQVVGSARDALAYARAQVEIELNGAADNPLFLPDEDTVLTGANFQGTPVSLPFDLLGIVITMVSALSERRLNRLLNPALSVGLNAFLAEDPGLHSGFMASQYTAGHLVAAQKVLATPATIHSIPGCADQEDFVSMGLNTIHKCCDILEHGYGVLAIEFMAAATALSKRDLSKGRGTQAAADAIGREVPPLCEDRPLHDDQNRIVELVRTGKVLQSVENAVGSLHTYG